jgi:Zn-finger nucleic acid-binding protein
MPSCPRCRQELVENQVDEFTVQLCVPCKGVFVPHADVVKILDRSWRAVSPEEAEKAAFVAPADWQAEPVLPCPRCAAAMSKYGYMGLAAIQLDRCDRCQSLWLDAEELQKMVLALARTNYRSERALRRERETMHDITSAGMRGAVAGRDVTWEKMPEADGVLTVAALLLRLLR